MRVQFLGDALDHWKFSVLSRLVTKGLLKDLKVVPMVTDDKRWHESDKKAYSFLLGVRPEDITSWERLTPKSRDEYFRLIPQTPDLFLDPDTGVATSSPGPQHITSKDICKLLPTDGNSGRVLAIYQHSARGSFQSRLKKVSAFISQEVPNTFNCVYECGRVAVLFVSREKSRIANIQAFLRKMLGNKSRRRIWDLS